MFVFLINRFGLTFFTIFLEMIKIIEIRFGDRICNKFIERFSYLQLLPNSHNNGTTPTRIRCNKEIIDLTLLLYDISVNN